MTTDPRLNAPATISSLHGDDRARALYARHNASTAAYMARWTQPKVKPTLFERMRDVLLGRSNPETPTNG